MTREERAQQLWSILILAARSRQIWTYDLVGHACGVPAPSLGEFLRPLQQYCIENRLPPLTSLIVNKKTGLPGPGFDAAANVPEAHQQVFSKDWDSVRAPSTQQLEDAYRRIT